MHFKVRCIKYSETNNKINTVYPIQKRSVKQLAGSYKSLGWILEVRTHPLPPPDLDCVMQDVKLQLLNLQWFRVLGSSFSRFWGLRFRSRVLRFRVLGASFSRFRGLRFRSRVLRASVFVFECFVFETTLAAALHQIPSFISSGVFLRCTLTSFKSTFH